MFYQHNFQFIVKNNKYLIHASSISIHGSKENYSVKSKNSPIPLMLFLNLWATNL